MRVWLDDIRPMPAGFDIHCRSVDEVMPILDRVTYISFDHDLGDINAKTGYDLACEFEKRAARGDILHLIGYHIHSANPVGAKRITVAMSRCRTYQFLGGKP